MLVTLRLHLADGRERQLSYELDDAESQSAEEVLRRMNPDGEVSLGDRDSCPIEAVQRVELVRPKEATAPEWFEEGKPAEATLRDEDVTTALREQ